MRLLLDAAERELWKPDEETLWKLKEAYPNMEGTMEEKLGTIEGEFQGESVDVVTAEEVEGWKAKMDGAIVTVAHDEFLGMGLSGVSGFMDEGAVVA